MAACRVDEENDYENIEDEANDDERGAIRLSTLIEENEEGHDSEDQHRRSSSDSRRLSGRDAENSSQSESGARSRRLAWRTRSRQQKNHHSTSVNLETRLNSVQVPDWLRGRNSRFWMVVAAFAMMSLILILQMATLSKVGCHHHDHNCVEKESDVTNFHDAESEKCKNISRQSNETLPYHEILLLRQDLSGDYVNESRTFSTDEFMELNSGDPTARLFSRMRFLQYFKRPDGNFRFLLCYPLDKSSADQSCYDFIQASNPLEVTEASQHIKGFKIIKWLGHQADSFSGLRSDSRPLALLDGSPGSHWYWSVGSAATYLGDRTIPGPAGRGGSGTAGWVELYAVLGGEDDVQ